MPDNAAELQAAMQASMATNKAQQALTDESRVLLAGLLRTEMCDAVADGITSGISKLIKDEEAMQKFWSTGYKHLTDRATDNASKWVGKRILTALAVALFVMSVTWLVKTGALK